MQLHTAHHCKCISLAINKHAQTSHIRCRQKNIIDHHHPNQLHRTSFTLYCLPFPIIAYIYMNSLKSLTPWDNDAHRSARLRRQTANAPLRWTTRQFRCIIFIAFAGCLLGPYQVILVLSTYSTLSVPSIHSYPHPHVVWLWWQMTKKILSTVYSSSDRPTLHTLVIYPFAATNIIYGHTKQKALHPVRSAKLSCLGPRQYYGGGPHGNPRCRRSFAALAFYLLFLFLLLFLHPVRVHTRVTCCSVCCNIFVP